MTHFGVLAIAIREEKEVRGVNIWKEGVKLSLFTDSILYVEDTKESTKNFLEAINWYRKVTSYKVNSHKSIGCILTYKLRIRGKRDQRICPIQISVQGEMNSEPKD